MLDLSVGSNTRILVSQLLAYLKSNQNIGTFIIKKIV